MMFESLITVAAIVALVVIVIRQNTRLDLMRRELGALRSLVLSMSPGATKPAPAVAAGEQTSVTSSADAITPVPVVAASEMLSPAGAPDAVIAEPSEAGPATVAADPGAAPAPGPWASAPPPKARPDFETALGTRWVVWVGGLALALGGVFLIRYSIEAGLFGPVFRLSMAAIFGLALVAVGEFVRRTGFTGPVEGAAGAYVPGILTAAGAFVLFGTVYSAHAVYDFIGPALAFGLMGAIGVGSIVAALVHGQALAGVGLLGSMITPVLVNSQQPNVWALFVYLAIVLAANTAIARLRDWRFLVTAGFVGAGLWNLVYLASSEVTDLTAIVFINAVWLASLAFIWLFSRPAEPGAADKPSIAPAIFSGLTAAALLVDPTFAAANGPLYGTLILATLIAIALYRTPALALLHGAGIVALLIHLRLAFEGTFAFRLFGEDMTIDGFSVEPVAPSTVWTGMVLALLLLAAGYASALRFVAAAPRRAAIWAGWGTAVPLVVVAALWITLGNIDVDIGYAAAALALASIFAVGGEAIARRETPPLHGGRAVSLALIGSGLAAVLALHMAFEPALTTMLIGAAAVVPALATRRRAYPVLGWLCVGAVVIVMGRVGMDPTIVGAELLGKTPIFNALLPGYGIPTLAFIFCAWQLARTTNGRPRLVMEAASALFGLLTVAILVRHAMNGGVIDAGAPTLSEQSIYTLLALGAGAILLAIDMRSPSPVLRIGSMAAGVASAVLTVTQHFLVLNPLFTDESTGRIPVFNLLFLAYLLPALAAGALAWYSRGKRPLWYSSMLGLLAAVLAFAYATLSVRRLFQGEHIALWAGMSQLETYSYSALWLAIGVLLLVLGVMTRSQILRIASAALIAISVAKVFIFDMSELEGVLRALSFIGLGAVLIGIGLFYQRLLTRASLRAG